MTREEMFMNAMKKNVEHEKQASDGNGFKKFSDAIPAEGFNKKNNGFQKETQSPELPKDKESVYRRVAKFLVMIGED